MSVARLPEPPIRDDADTLGTMHPSRARRHCITGVARVIMACMAAAISASSAGAAPQYERTAPYDAAVSHMRKAIEPVGSGQHHALLISLRSLRDPQLRGLFESLTNSSDFTSRVDGILGLAELSPEAGVDPVLLGRFSSREDRSAAIRSAIGLKLVTAKAALELLKIQDLTGLDRAALAGELFRLGTPINPELLKEALNDPSDEVAGLGAMLMLQSGDRSAWSRYVDRLMARDELVRNAVVGELGKAALAYQLKAAVPALLALVSRDGFRTPTRMVINGAALSLDRDAGIAAWREIIASDRSQPTLVRAGLQMLAHEGDVPEPVIAMLRNDDELVEDIVSAIIACSGTDSDAAAATLERLVQSGNRQAVEWAMRRASTLPAPAAARVLMSVFRAGTGPSSTPPLRAMALDAAGRLAKADPSAIVTLLRENASSSGIQELLLLGMVSVVADQPLTAQDSALAAQAAAAATVVQGASSRRAESLALLLLARTAQGPLDSETLRALGIVAAGGGDLDPTLQVQAAWLFVRHSGRGEQALAQLRPQ
jgi:hypothetical protein